MPFISTAIEPTVTGDVCELTLQPKSATARKMMPQIKIAFSTKDASLRSTELQFADGSIMRSDFKNPQLNPQLNLALHLGLNLPLNLQIGHSICH